MPIQPHPRIPVKGVLGRLTWIGFLGVGTGGRVDVDEGALCLSGWVSTSFPDTFVRMEK